MDTIAWGSGGVPLLMAILFDLKQQHGDVTKEHFNDDHNTIIVRSESHLYVAMDCYRMCSLIYSCVSVV